MICGRDDEEEESGDWLICMRIFALDNGAAAAAAASSSFPLGVLKAPVLCFCSFSNISCSSLGRRGGEGPEPNGDCAVRAEMPNERLDSCLGRRIKVRIAVGIVVGGEKNVI